MSEHLTDYLKEISQYPVLTAEEEQELFAEYNKTKDERIKEKIYLYNLRLVVSVARQYFNCEDAVDQMDIIMNGNIGLNTAIERFDITRGFKFSTYATYWIRQAITRALANSASTIRHPVHAVELKRKIRMTIQQYMENTNGQVPSKEYVANELGIKNSYVFDEMYKTVVQGSCVLSLNNVIGEDEHGDCTELLDMIKSNEKTPEEEYEEKELHEIIMKILNEAPISDKYKDMFIKRYGLETGIPRTLEDIAQEYGVTRERVRQVTEKVLLKVFVTNRSIKMLSGYNQGRRVRPELLFRKNCRFYSKDGIM